MAYVQSVLEAEYVPSVMAMVARIVMGPENATIVLGMGNAGSVEGKELRKLNSSTNKTYWAGVYFAFGLGMVIGLAAASAKGGGWLRLGAALGAALASFGSWYTAGALIGIMLVGIADMVEVFG